MARTKLEIPLFYAGADIDDAETRVVETGLFLLRTLRRVPTRENIVDALKVPGKKMTAKATVSNYYGSFESALMSALDIADWLPEEVPDFINDALKKLIGWARSDADRQLKEKREILSRQEDRLREKESQRQEELESLHDIIDDLKKKAGKAEGKLDTLNDRLEKIQAERDTLKESYSEETKATALLRKDIEILEEKYQAAVESRDLYKNRLEQSETELKMKKGEAEKLNTANDNKARQIIDLQDRNAELTNKSDNALAQIQEMKTANSKLQDSILEHQQRWREETQRAQELLTKVRYLEQNVEHKESDLSAAEEKHKILMESNVRLQSQLDSNAAIIDRLSRGFSLEQERDGVKK